MYGDALIVGLLLATHNSELDGRGRVQQRQPELPACSRCAAPEQKGPRRGAGARHVEKGLGQGGWCGVGARCRSRSPGVD
jgi:hypothetical protein